MVPAICAQAAGCSGAALFLHFFTCNYLQNTADVNKLPESQIGKVTTFERHEPLNAMRAGLQALGGFYDYLLLIYMLCRERRLREVFKGILTIT
jgi:hypothetical protein